jgi:hypothetical protein
LSRPGFPTSLPAFQRQFPSEEACFKYLVDSRWPDGFACPSCGGQDAYERRDRLALQCVACNRYFTATAGTVMHRTRQPLSSWLLAAFLMVVDSNRSRP